jgi:hypothetical protein
MAGFMVWGAPVSAEFYCISVSLWTISAGSRARGSTLIGLSVQGGPNPLLYLFGPAGYIASTTARKDTL